MPTTSLIFTCPASTLTCTLRRRCGTPSLAWASCGAATTPPVRLRWVKRVRTTLMFITVIVQVQRYCNVSTERRAKAALYLNFIGVALLISCACLCGIALYGFYGHCDPLRAGAITKTDQLMPYFVMAELQHLPGLAGLFVSCVFSASLSTMSSGFNALATVTYDDFLGQTAFMKALPERKVQMVSKAVAFGYGILAILMAFVVSQINSILEVGERSVDVLTAHFVWCTYRQPSPLRALWSAQCLAFSSSASSVRLPTPLASSAASLPASFLASGCSLARSPFRRNRKCCPLKLTSVQLMRPLLLPPRCSPLVRRWRRWTPMTPIERECCTFTISPFSWCPFLVVSFHS